MNPKNVLAHVRRLCDDIDAARPVRYGVRYVVLPFAVPAALGFGIGVAGCGTSSPHERDDEVCDNGIDDDENSLVDCDDEACDADPGCLAADPGCEPLVEYCEDEFDNNGDGATDCADLCCDAFCFARDCPMCDYGVPFDPPDNEIDCGDDRDEDCDGQTDCCDPDCDDDPLCAG
jgi:hypothetical protein